MFWIKRHVTFHKTTRRFQQNNTSLFTNQPKGDGDTCDSKKCKLPVRGARAARTLHAREGDRDIRFRLLSLIGEIGDCIAVKNTSVLQYENSILVLQKNFSSLFCVFFTHQGNIYPYTCRRRIEKGAALHHISTYTAKATPTYHARKSCTPSSSLTIEREALGKLTIQLVWSRATE